MIGIYGGTFNPVHYGHLRSALEVQQLLGLDELRLLPCRLPPHRQEPEVSPEARLAMLKLATAHTPSFRIDTRELERSGPSYMVDTLHSIRDEQPQQPLLLFIGSDAFAGLANWHQWPRLFDYAHIVVMTRPGFSHGKLSEFFQQRLRHTAQLLKLQSSGLLFFQAVTQLEISATQVRHLVKQGKNPQFLLPDAVIDYIRQHRLYHA